MSTPPLFETGEVWLSDLLIAALDGDERLCNELVAQHTGLTPGGLVDLASELLGIVTKLGTFAVGSEDAYRTMLREVGALLQLGDLTD